MTMVKHIVMWRMTESDNKIESRSQIPIDTWV